MQINDVMAAATQDKEYNVSFTFFSQAEYLWPNADAHASGAEGVCLALAMRWIASGGTIAYINQFNDDKNSEQERSRVAELQSQVPDDDLELRDHFIATEMDRLNYSGIGDTLLSLPLLRAQGKMPEEAAYLPEVGRNVVALLPDSGALIRIISPSGGSSNQHATAMYRAKGSGTLSFFDPNGGVIAFETLAAGGKWFAEELPKATGNDYNKISSIRIRRFRPK
jgi:hypothetical protein